MNSETKNVRKAYGRASGNHQASRSKRQKQIQQQQHSVAK